MMRNTSIDHDHLNGHGGRIPQYSRLDRVRAGGAGHRSIQLLARRRCMGKTDATLVKQYCRIERGNLA